MRAPESMRAWAAAASWSGNVEWMTGRALPSASSGQPRSRRAFAMGVFSATLRGRRVEPVTVSRFTLIASRLISLLIPRRVTIWTSCPSVEVAIRVTKSSCR